MTRMSGTQAEARIIVGLEGRPGGLRKLCCLGVDAGGARPLGRLLGQDDRGDRHHADSATLHATGRCDAGETCTWYWEYWPASSPRTASVSKKTPVQGPVHGASPDVPLSTVITDLKPNTTYRWVFCGSPNNGADYVCVGPHGQGGSTDGRPPAGL